MFDFTKLTNQELLDCRHFLAELFYRRDPMDNVVVKDDEKDFYNKYFDRHYSLNDDIAAIEDVIILHNKISHEMADRFEKSLLGSV